MPRELTPYRAIRKAAPYLVPDRKTLITGGHGVCAAFDFVGSDRTLERIGEAYARVKAGTVDHRIVITP